MIKGRKVLKNAMNAYSNCIKILRRPYSTPCEPKIPTFNLDEKSIKRLY